jgi:hypothetical protein
VVERERDGVARAIMGEGAMRTPIRPIPSAVATWMFRVRWLRWLDAALAWGGVWVIAAAALSPASGNAAAVIALLAVGLGMMLRPLRVRWRPIAGAVSLAVSRELRAGDRAWYVRARDASLVLVTARHGVRVVVTRPDLGGDEAITVRRTRVLLLPADAGPGSPGSAH